MGLLPLLDENDPDRDGGREEADVGERPDAGSLFGRLQHEQPASKSEQAGCGQPGAFRGPIQGDAEREDDENKARDHRATD